jgi:HAD superfamily hydrolase (TIGR01509 family)
MAVAAVVFDFDGLLMDTETTSLASWQHEWRRHGLELDSSSFFADHGGDVSDVRYAELAAAVGPAFDRAASHARRLAYRDQLNASLELLPGIAGWLSQARRLGIRLAVATSSPRGWASRHLGGHGSLAAFEFLACGDEVARAKPDPGVYLLALERLGLPADRVVAVEDSPHGVAAAQAAGLRCVAIPNPHADPARFAAADLLLASAEQMPLDEVLRTLEPSRNNRP